MGTSLCPAGSREEESSCGRPLGIRAGPNGTLFVADAYLGLFQVNPTTGEGCCRHRRLCGDIRKKTTDTECYHVCIYI
ncbi:Adipocyte plasma membrane-associated protein [Liparis tanakae]|uniref:Adipocyte plasma membrane-associated protein n=1 Tax=Liparis tanakae TaxID=230148 RepID=A0A4Z2E1Q9_9TELE|nr:Adipocyte plasma membrane-associated protein [Liparis tanakae]